MPVKPERALFAGRERSTFTVVATGIPGSIDRPFGPVDLELVDVENRSTDVVNAFALLFRGPRHQEFGQSNYRLSHPEFGEVDLFLVPIMDPQPRDDRVCYQAIVNRLRV